MWPFTTKKPSIKRGITPEAREVIEDSARKVIGDIFTGLVHTNTQGINHGDKHDRQCVCAAKERTESGFEYMIEKPTDQGKYKLKSYFITYEGERIQIWYGICNVCKVCYWEANTPHNTDVKAVLKVGG